MQRLFSRELPVRRTKDCISNLFDSTARRLPTLVFSFTLRSLGGWHTLIPAGWGCAHGVQMDPSAFVSAGCRVCFAGTDSRGAGEEAGGKEQHTDPGRQLVSEGAPGNWPGLDLSPRMRSPNTRATNRSVPLWKWRTSLLMGSLQAKRQYIVWYSSFQKSLPSLSFCVPGITHASSHLILVFVLMNLHLFWLKKKFLGSFILLEVEISIICHK